MIEMETDWNLSDKIEYDFEGYEKGIKKRYVREFIRKARKKRFRLNGRTLIEWKDIEELAGSKLKCSDNYN